MTKSENVTMRNWHTLMIGSIILTSLQFKLVRGVWKVEAEKKRISKKSYRQRRTMAEFGWIKMSFYLTLVLQFTGKDTFNRRVEIISEGH